MFVVTWAIALAVWRFGRIEERWSAHLGDAEAAGWPRCVRQIAHDDQRPRRPRLVVDEPDRGDPGAARLGTAGLDGAPARHRGALRRRRPGVGPAPGADAVARGVLGVSEPRGARAPRPDRGTCTSATGRASTRWWGATRASTSTASAAARSPCSPPEQLDPVREHIRSRFGYTTRFTHFAIVGLCADCAAQTRDPPDEHPNAVATAPVTPPPSRPRTLTFAAG